MVNSVDSEINGETLTTMEPLQSIKTQFPTPPVALARKYPEGNILTNIKFPCPTLLRKSKSLHASMNLYEEVKSGHARKVSSGSSSVTEEDEEVGSVRSQSDSESMDENNNGNDGSVVSSSSGTEVLYINLQELEVERRRLVAAQRVRAKYAQTWMIDGQIIEESLLGENKEKTKMYWESRMRHDQLEREKEKLNELIRRSRSSSSSVTSPVIQRINAEIDELHKREMELLTRSSTSSSATTVTLAPINGYGGGSSRHEDDDDVFSSTESSVDEFEHSESPRLESGFYSNLGEDDTHAPEIGLIKSLPEEVKVPPAIVLVEDVENGRLHSPTIVSPTIEIQSFKDEEEKPDIRRSEVIQDSKVILRSSSPEVNLLLKDHEPTKLFEFQSETPIEKEIRLTRQREEEHRIRRSTSIGPDRYLTKPTNERRISSSDHAENMQGRIGGNFKTERRDVQYEMAAGRLRKEMLEAQEREDELRHLHRSVSMTNVFKNDVSEAPRVTGKLWVNEIESKMSEEKIQEPIVPVVQGSNIPKRISKKSLKLTTSSPNTSRNSVIKSPIGKPGIGGFNSIQRYLLKSTVQFRIGTNFQVPPPASPIISKEIQNPNVIEEEEEVQPRRKLIPATHKIQSELREMKERESELALLRTRRRDFQSTPNLVLTENEEPTIQPDFKDNAVMSEIPVYAPPKERKRSNLISQWERRIHNVN